MSGLDWNAVLQALKVEAREAQNKANRHNLTTGQLIAADQHAELLRVMVRALSAGIKGGYFTE